MAHTYIVRAIPADTKRGPTDWEFTTAQAAHRFWNELKTTRAFPDTGTLARGGLFWRDGDTLLDNFCADPAQAAEMFLPSAALMKD